jgi:hypothetical protein
MVQQAARVEGPPPAPEASPSGKPAELGPDWVILRDCRLRPADRGSSPSVLIHPARGIAVLDVHPFETPGAEDAVRGRLDAARFPAIFAGDLPVVHLRVTPRQMPFLPALLDDAFAAQPPLRLPGGDAWVGVATRALAAEQRAPRREAPQPHEAPADARRRRRRAAVLRRVSALLLCLAALGGGLALVLGDGPAPAPDPGPVAATAPEAPPPPAATAAFPAEEIRREAAVPAPPAPVVEFVPLPPPPPAPAPPVPRPSETAAAPEPRQPAPLSPAPMPPAPVSPAPVAEAKPPSPQRAAPAPSAPRRAEAPPARRAPERTPPRRQQEAAAPLPESPPDRCRRVSALVGSGAPIGDADIRFFNEACIRW